VNAAQLQAWFAANQKPVLGVAAAGAVGLGVLRARKRSAAGGGASGRGAVPATAGTAFATGPAIAGTATPYDSSVLDAYNGLQEQLDGITNRLTAPLPVPEAPVASKLFAPQGTGNYVHFDGIGGEVESDGSVFGITAEQWQQILARDPNAGAKITTLSTGPTNWWSTEKNVTAAAAAAATKQS
jgi:hypothetical protein